MGNIRRYKLEVISWLNIADIDEIEHDDGDWVKWEDVEGLVKENSVLQAKIDALMFEYCPDEMTPEQIAEWERNQVAYGAMGFGIRRSAGTRDGSGLTLIYLSKGNK